MTQSRHLFDNQKDKYLPTVFTNFPIFTRPRENSRKNNKYRNDRIIKGEQFQASCRNRGYVSAELGKASMYIYL